MESINATRTRGCKRTLCSPTLFLKAARTQLTSSARLSPFSPRLELDTHTQHSQRNLSKPASSYSPDQHLFLLITNTTTITLSHVPPLFYLYQSTTSDPSPRPSLSGLNQHDGGPRAHRAPDRPLWRVHRHQPGYAHRNELHLHPLRRIPRRPLLQVGGVCDQPQPCQVGTAHHRLRTRAAQDHCLQC